MGISLVAMRIHAVENDMPFKSQAQRRKFAQLLVQGKISAATFEEWNSTASSLHRACGEKQRVKAVTAVAQFPDRKRGTGVVMKAVARFSVVWCRERRSREDRLDNRPVVVYWPELNLLVSRADVDSASGERPSRRGPCRAAASMQALEPPMPPTVRDRWR